MNVPVGDWPRMTALLRDTSAAVLNKSAPRLLPGLETGVLGPGSPFSGY